MTTTGKIVTCTALVGAAGLGTFWYVKRRASELVVNAEPYLHGIDLHNLSFRIDLTVKNPSSMTFPISYPFMVLEKETINANNESQRVIIGSSIPKPEKISLSANSTIKIPGIKIEIPLLNLPGIGMDIFDTIKNKAPLSLFIKTHLRLQALGMLEIKIRPIEKAIVIKQ